jgi:transcriptional regulator with XRE-family HTH domain
MQREFTSIGERIKWAIEQTGQNLTTIGEAIGCSHATLSQWQTGKTDMTNAKLGLVVAFCDYVGINLQWLLTGDGPVREKYASLDHPLVVEALHIAADLPHLADQACRVLVAMEPPPPTPPH